MDDYENFYYETNIIYGIGNEVLFGIIFLIFTFSVALFILKRYENVTRVSRIHPSNLNAVNETRSQRSNQTQSEANTTSPFLVNGTRRYGSMDGNCPVCLNSLHLPIETNCGHLFCGRCIVIYWQHAQWRGGPIRCPVCRQQVNIMFPCFPTNIANTSTESSSFASTTSEWIQYFLSFIYSPTAPDTATPNHNSTDNSQTTNSATLESELLNSTLNGNNNLHTISETQQPDDLLNNQSSAVTTTQTTTFRRTTTTTQPTPNPIDERTKIVREINNYNRNYSGEPRPWSDYLYDLPTLLRHLTNDFFSYNGLMYVFRLRIVLCVVAAIMYLISPLDMIPEAVFGIFGLFDDIIVVLLLAIYVTIIYRRFLSSRWEIE